MENWFAVDGPFFTWLGRSSWQAAFLVLLVLSVQWLFGKRLAPAWKFNLWFLVVLRLLLPVSPESVVSVFNWAKPKMVRGPVLELPPMSSTPTLAQEASDRNNATAPFRDGSVESSTPLRETMSASSETVAPISGSPLSVSWTISRSWTRVWPLVWLAGAVFFLIRLIAQNVRFAARLRRSSPVTDSAVLELLDRCYDTMGTPRRDEVGAASVVAPSATQSGSPEILSDRGDLAGARPSRPQQVQIAHDLETFQAPTSVRTRCGLEGRAPFRLRFLRAALYRQIRPLALVETSLVKSPALYGCFRPRLLLPAGMTARFTQAELRYVFLHELAHLKRFDPMVNWLMTLLNTVHWFNPFVWLAFHRMRADRELACDALVLAKAKDGENRPYGQAIIKLLESLAQPAAMPGLVGILEDRNQMKRRIRMIAAFKKSRRGSVVTALLVAVLSVAGLTDSQSPSSPEPRDEKSRIGELRVEGGKTNEGTDAQPLTQSPRNIGNQSLLTSAATAKGKGRGESETAASSLTALATPAASATPVVNNGPSMKVIVLEAETGKPLPGAEVMAPNWGAFYGEVEPAPRWRTDSSGTAVIRLGEIPTEPIKQRTWFPISVRLSGFAPLGLSWSAERDDARVTMPKELVVRLQRGITVGGLVRDEDGAPLSDIRVRCFGRGYSYANWNQRQKEYPEFWIGTEEYPDVVTDREGRFTVTDFPTDLDNATITLIRPDGSSRIFSSSGPSENPNDPEGEPFIMSYLRARTAALIFKGGFTVRGQVLDPMGQPLSGVLVREGAGLGGLRSSREFRTDSQGRFELRNRLRGQIVLTAQPDHLAITSAIMDVAPQTPEVRIQVTPLSPLRIRVEDDKRMPMAGTNVRLDDYRTEGQLIDFIGATGADGSLVWTNAPHAPVALVAHSPTLKATRKLLVRPEQREVTITLREGASKEIFVRGPVRDAANSQPIRQYWVGFQTGDREAFERRDRFDTPDLLLPIPAVRFRSGMHPSYQLRFEADGYDTLLTQWRDFDEGHWDTDFVMHPAMRPGGQIVLPNGQPAGLAEITVQVLQDYGLMSLSEHGMVHSIRPKWTSTSRANKDGSFEMAHPGWNSLVLITHQGGFHQTTVDQLKSRPRIALQPWGRVEGVLQVGSRLGAHAKVHLGGGSGYVNGWFFSFEATTDAVGRFVFERVPPGDHLLFRNLRDKFPRPINEGFYHRPITVKAGETTKVEYGGIGRPIVGQVRGNFDWLNDDHELILKQTNQLGVLRFQDYATRAAFEKARDFHYAVERRRHQFAARVYPLRIEPDGSFRIDDVPAGAYDLRIRVTAPPKSEAERRAPSWRPKEVASMMREVIVPPIPGGCSDEPMNLGVLELDRK